MARKTGRQQGSSPGGADHWNDEHPLGNRHGGNSSAAGGRRTDATRAEGEADQVNEIRVPLATKHGASIGCPIATGIFALVAARAAAENEAEGKKRITPYWRTLKAQGEVNPKYPGGPAAQGALLKAEGHTVIARDRRLFCSGL